MPRAVILTALPVEYLAVRRHLTDLQEETHPRGTIYERGTFTAPEQTWEVGIVEIGAGNTGAALEAERAIAHFSPDVILFVGVAGGIKDVALGDVVASTKIYGYESGKAEEMFKPRPNIGLSDYGLEQRARAEARKPDWLKRLSSIHSQTPKVYVAPIAAGEKVVASIESEIFQFLRSNYGDTVAIEMEGFGFLEAVRANQNVSAMVIRGISDLVNGKNDDAIESEEARQERASNNASAFAYQILAALTQDKPSIQDSFEKDTPEVKLENPPIIENFIGREEDLTEYLKKLEDTRQVFISGLAGIGKTTIAAKIYDKLTTNRTNTNAKKRIIWATLREKDNIDGFCVAIADHAKNNGQIHSENIIREKTDIDRKTDQLASYFDQNIDIFFLDDLHKLTEDSYLLEILIKKLPDQCRLTKFIYISRRHHLVKSSKKLEGLDLKSSLILLKKLNPNLNSINENKLVLLADKYSGHPKALEVIAACLDLESPDELMRDINSCWKDPDDGNNLTPLLKSLFNHLSEEDYFFACMIATLSKPIPSLFTDKIVGYCNQYHKKNDSLVDYKYSLQRLRKYYILEKKYSIIVDNGIEKLTSMHDLVKDYCIFEANDDDKAKFNKAIFQIFFSILPETIKDLLVASKNNSWPFVPEKIKDYNANSEEIPLDFYLLSKHSEIPEFKHYDILQEILYYSHKLDKSDKEELHPVEFSEILFLLDRFLHRWGFLEQLMEYIQYAEKHKLILSPQVKIRKARILMEWNRSREAISILQPMLTENYTSYSKKDLYLVPTVVHLELGLAFSKMNDIINAIEHYEIALERYSSEILNEAKGLSRVNALIGDEKKKQGKYEEAEQYYDRAYKLNLENNQNYYAALNLQRLGELAIIREDYNLAILILEKSKNQIEQSSISGTTETKGSDYARIKLSLARALVERDILEENDENISAIKALLDSAKQIFLEQKLTNEEKEVVNLSERADSLKK